MTLTKGLNAVSIDRIDSAGAYTLSNVMLVCKWVNLGRGVSSVEDFVNHVLKPLRENGAAETPLGRPDPENG